MIGDGAALYGIQGLWTAAKYRIPVTLVVPNNAGYQILKVGAKGLALPQAMAGRYLGLDLDTPAIDYVGLANAFGVEAARVTEPDELMDRLQASWQRDTPLLLEVPIERTTPTKLNY